MKRFQQQLMIVPALVGLLVMSVTASQTKDKIFAVSTL